MSPEVHTRSEELYERHLKEMTLAELRCARELYQEAPAEILGVKQPGISKMERRAGMFISSLRSHIKAMGSELDIIARFPDGDLKYPVFSIFHQSVSNLFLN